MKWILLFCLLGMGWLGIGTGCAGSSADDSAPTPAPVTLLFFYTDN